MLDLIIPGYNKFKPVLFNVPGAGDVAPAFGAQCGVARGATATSACPVLYEAACPTCSQAGEYRTYEPDCQRTIVYG